MRSGKVWGTFSGLGVLLKGFHVAIIKFRGGAFEGDIVKIHDRTLGAKTLFPVFPGRRELEH